MTYAIISVGGKQYRVREGQRLLVDRMAAEDGATFNPDVLLVGGDGDARLAPDGVTVTARVIGAERGPKIRIGKYRKRTGYRRHTGFRSALSQIEIESIAAKKARAAKPKAQAEGAEPAAEAAPARTRARASRPRAEETTGEATAAKPRARAVSKQAPEAGPAVAEAPARAARTSRRPTTGEEES